MKKTNMLTKKKINKALDAFYWGDISNPKTDEYGSGYKLLYKDEDTINLVGGVLHALIEKYRQNFSWHIYILTIKESTKRWKTEKN